MKNIFKDTKNFFVNWKEERENERILRAKGLIITEMRICTSKKEEEYIKAHIFIEDKKMFFLSKRVVECNSILCDVLGNVYRIVTANYEQNKFLDDKVTLICNYDSYIPQNDFRKSVSQVANITQSISGMSFNNVENVHLDINQIGKIEQSISINQLVDSADEEMKYRFKPISNRELFISIIKEIISGKRTIEDLEDKVIQKVLKQASGLLKTLLDLLLKKLRNNVEQENRTKELVA